MTIREILKCDVCGATILIRTQIGWLDEHPIRIHCGKCGIFISGKLFLNQKEVTYRFEFQNASSIGLQSEVVPDFYIEASGELLTCKIRPNEDSGFIALPPPFFNTLHEMGVDKYQDFKQRILQFLHLCKNDWTRLRRINELWVTKKYKYLTVEVLKYLPKEKFPMDNELEYLRGVHQINLIFFYNIIDHIRFTRTTELFFKEIEQLGKRNVKKLVALQKYFSERDLLTKYDEKLFKTIDSFIEIFPFLIPAFSLKFYNKISDDLLKDKGMSTASFDDLKQFYLDCYEVVADVLVLNVAYDNLKYRGNYDKMTTKRRDVEKINDFRNLNKGDRLRFVGGSEVFETLVSPYLDNEIRNSIGHNTYEYDGASQMITFHPKINDTSRKINIYLLDFARKCWDLFLMLIDLLELVYQTRKIYCLSLGIIPIAPCIFTKT